MTVEQVPKIEVLHPEVPAALGYAALTMSHDAYRFEGVSFSPNPAYEQYLRMHKVFVGTRGAEQLEEIHHQLKEEEMPRYVLTAGWAAVEAALVRTDKDIPERLALFDAGVGCWKKALETQLEFNASAPSWLVEYAAPYRSALDLAISPLLRTMIQGYVPKLVCRSVFEDCLNIAQANAVRINLSAREGHIEALAEHVGFGYECNGLLAVNRRMSATRFAIPSMIRSDSGYHHAQQTHDLIIVEQDRGRIVQLTPVEIKATVSTKDRMRYKALLVRGKMHLSVDGKFRAEDTLAALSATYEGTATLGERDIAESVTNRMLSMFKDYCAGECLGKVASGRSMTVFHNNAQVAANHPGLLAKVG
ncbi:MAG: hypothetical protein JWP13_387 [Candidatus Saccharibacteria bacterium]|nr:hypothetical protein [Candidatus Saccharibacteria bacterium]